MGGPCEGPGCGHPSHAGEAPGASQTCYVGTCSCGAYGVPLDEPSAKAYGRCHMTLDEATGRARPPARVLAMHPRHGMSGVPATFGFDLGAPLKQPPAPSLADVKDWTRATCGCDRITSEQPQHVTGHPPGHPFCRYEGHEQAHGEQPPAETETSRARGERLLAAAAEYDRKGQRSLASAVRKMAQQALTRANMRDEGIKQEPRT